MRKYRLIKLIQRNGCITLYITHNLDHIAKQDKCRDGDGSQAVSVEELSRHDTFYDAETAGLEEDKKYSGNKNYWGLVWPKIKIGR